MFPSPSSAPYPFVQLDQSTCLAKQLSPLRPSPGLQALPSWAQKTLEKHASDPRNEKSLQQLEQGKTGDALWDAAQQQLASTGAPSPPPFSPLLCLSCNESLAQMAEELPVPVRVSPAIPCIIFLWLSRHKGRTFICLQHWQAIAICLLQRVAVVFLSSNNLYFHQYPIVPCNCGSLHFGMHCSCGKPLHVVATQVWKYLATSTVPYTLKAEAFRDGWQLSMDICHGCVLIGAPGHDLMPHQSA